ncbi:MAG: chorismate--pyruvate lyase [Alteromonadaceae bacterium]|jgi:chorismate--pyruvate lyase
MNSQNPLFPITMKTRWQSTSNFTIAQPLLDWLLDPCSLTARFKKHCQHFRIEVLGQQIQACASSEANEDIKAGEQVLVREVLIYCDDKPQVFARSLLPLKSLTGEEQQLAHLGNQSLGQVLFNNPELIRKNIEVSSFDAQDSLSDLLISLSLPSSDEIWGRRSVFILHDKPLMVAEIFLPGSLAYQFESSTS